jgi:hypothetical protein
MKRQNQNERKVMNNQFDKLAKAMAQSVTRRAALKKFGVGMGLFALAALGLPDKAEAAPGGNGKNPPPLPGYGEPCLNTGSKKHPIWSCQPGLVCRYGGLTNYQHICT